MEINDFESVRLNIVIDQDSGLSTTNMEVTAY